MEKTFKEKLVELGACFDATEWVGDKSWKEAFETCRRGDWLLWLFKKTMSSSEDDLRRITLAKGHCAKTVIHLMKDKRSISAVDVAIRFGNNEADRDELNAAAAAYAAYSAAAADADAAYAAYSAAAADADAAAAAYSAAAAAYAADAAAYAADAAAYAADAARTDNQKATADICRKYLPIEVWNINI